MKQIGLKSTTCLTIGALAAASVAMLGAESSDRESLQRETSIVDVERLLTEVLLGDGAPGVVAPLDADGTMLVDPGDYRTGGAIPLGSHNLGLIAAADNILDLQCPNGGWAWPYGGCAQTATNITAPISMGLLRAYAATGDSSYLQASLDGGAHDLTATWSYGGVAFSSFDPAWFQMLTEVSGDPFWANTAKEDFFDLLDAGTYGDASSCGGTQYFPGDTSAYIERHKCQRGGSIINIRAWDMQYMPWVAGILGNPGQQDAFINDSILDALNNMDDSLGILRRGLAGAVHGLALVNHTSFSPINAPNFGAINGIDNLCDLADALVNFQESNGSFGSNNQSTAYAILALVAAQDAGCGPYDTEIADARAYLWTQQDGSDGAFWSTDAQTDKNIQYQGDALMALAGTGELVLNSDPCVTGGVLTVSIDKSATPGIEIFGGQFFLQYDNTVLSNPEVSGGDVPFDDPPFFVDIDTVAGTIDIGTAGGDPLNPEGTEDAVTMAVISFDAAEVCTQSDLVTFRPNNPPTRLTDGFGNPILPDLIDLHDVTIDGTAPVFASVPPNVTVPADAGTCSAVVEVMPDGWELSVNASVSNGVAELRSVVGDPEGQWGPTASLVYTPSVSMVFSDITELAADFNMLQGCIVGGSPRFAIGLDSDGDGEVNGHIVAHWGPEGSPWNHCPGSGWNSTNDLTASADGRWEAAQLGGGTAMTYGQVATLVAGLPNSDVVYVIVAVDGSWSQDQIVLVDNIQIGSSVHTFGNAIGNATAVDNCDNDPTVTAERDDNQPLDAPYPVGDTVITWTATDACGNEATATTTVTVDAVNEMFVDVSLQATVAPGPFTRCIEFELTDANGNVVATVSQTLTFTNGQATAAIEVPCSAIGHGSCLMARGPLHTLRSTGDLTIVGTEYVADGFDPLRGGDLNDDGVIDILDFGVFVWQFGEDYGNSSSGDTDCTTPFPHADIVGDGFVHINDFLFIQINFLQMDDICPIQLMAGQRGAFVSPIATPQPRRSVTVADLHRMGLSELAVADLNNDGVVDEQDIALFLAGERP